MTNGDALGWLIVLRFLIFAFIFSVVGAAGILYVLRRWRSHRFLGFRRAAKRLSGTVVDAEGLDAPFARFTAGNRPAMIEYGTVEGPSTRVRVLMPRRSP